MRAHQLLWLALLWPVIAPADERVLSLEDAVDQALQEAPQVAVSAAMRDAAGAVAPSAGRLPDPELVTGIDNLPINTADRFSFTRDFMTMRKIGVMQAFPNRQKRRLQSERAEREIAVAHGELLKTRYDTARAVAEVWIARATDEESLARLKSLKPESDLQAAAARAALASARASAAEALAAQSMAAALDERILALEQDAQIQRAELARWLGADAERPLAGIPTDLDLGTTPAALLAAVHQHPALAPALAKLAEAQTDVELARAQKRPDWSAELDYAQRGPDFSNLVSLEFHIGLPLFARHRQNPVIAEKLARVHAQEAERDPARKLAYLEEAIDLLDDMEESTVARNLRRSYTRRLLSQLVQLRSADVVTWFDYAQFLLQRLRSDVEALLAEDAALKAAYDEFMALWPVDVQQVLRRTP